MAVSRQTSGGYVKWPHPSGLADVMTGTLGRAARPTTHCARTISGKRGGSWDRTYPRCRFEAIGGLATTTSEGQATFYSTHAPGGLMPQPAAPLACPVRVALPPEQE